MATGTTTLEWEWQNADLTITVFDDSNGIRVLDGVQGHDAPARNISESRLVGIDGAIVVNRRYEARDVLIPMSLYTTVSVTDVIGTLAATFTNGPGVLRYTTETATRAARTRELRRVEYLAGLEGNMNRGPAALDYLRQVPVAFRAFDPWWYGDTDNIILALTGADSPNYDDAGINYNDPVVAYAGGSNTAVVEGLRAWTTVTLTGPMDAGSNLSISSTGDTLELVDALAGGDVLVVKAQPLDRGPRLNGGAVNFALVAAGSRPFEFLRGDNEFTFIATGTTVDSRIVVSWDNRFLTP